MIRQRTLWEIEQLLELISANSPRIPWEVSRQAIEVRLMLKQDLEKLPLIPVERNEG